MLHNELPPSTKMTIGLNKSVQAATSILAAVVGEAEGQNYRCLGKTAKCHLLVF
jgi:hypothetical protein